MSGLKKKVKNELTSPTKSLNKKPQNPFSPGRKFNNLKSVLPFYRRAELALGNDVKVSYQEEKVGIVLICVAIHRRCPYQVCARLEENASAPAGTVYRVAKDPFWVKHNHPPLFIPYRSDPSVPLPEPSPPTPPGRFVDFVYSISPKLLPYVPRILEIMDADENFPAEELLFDTDIAEGYLIEAGMPCFERKVFMEGLRKAAQKKEADLEHSNISKIGEEAYENANEATRREWDYLEQRYWLDAESATDVKWENWISEILGKGKGSKEKKPFVKKEPVAKVQTR